MHGQHWGCTAGQTCCTRTSSRCVAAGSSACSVPLLCLCISTLCSFLSRPMSVRVALGILQAQGVGMRGLLLRTRWESAS